MENAVFQEYKEQDQKRARIATLIWLVIFLLILLYPFLKHQNPPPGQEGILVSLGIPDVGDGNDPGAASQPETSEENTSSEEPEPTPEEPEPEPEPEEKKEEKKPKPKPKAETKEVIKDNSKEIALQKEKEKAEAAQKAKEEEARKKAAEAKRKAEEAAKKKAAEEAAKKAELDRKKAEANDLKNELGGLFGGGGGQGNTGTAGNQGSPDGDPDSKVLEGISTGAGKVGTGLANRGGAGPSIEDNSQVFGTVVIWVCIDTDGTVLSAKFTQGKQGETSTTSDPRLIRLAEANAKKWKFKTGLLDKQCGTITYDFKPK